MESHFMADRGGPQRAKKLVSHSWGSPFLTTVRNMVLDATEPHTKEISRELIVHRIIFPEVAATKPFSCLGVKSIDTCE